MNQQDDLCTIYGSKPAGARHQRLVDTFASSHGQPCSHAHCDTCKSPPAAASGRSQEAARSLALGSGSCELLHAAHADHAAHQGLTLVHSSAQPEPSLTQNAPCIPPDTP
jgi:hypothetical protein